MSGLHTQLGALAIAVNALAALIGGVAWLARRNPKRVLDRCCAPARC